MAEYGNNRVQKFTSTGSFVTKWGSSGSGNGQFSCPEGIETDFEGNVYVADSMNSRVQKFSSTGTYLFTLGTSGSGDGQLSMPGTVEAVYVRGTTTYRTQLTLAESPIL